MTGVRHPLASPAILPVALLDSPKGAPWQTVAPHSERLAAYKALLAGRPEGSQPTAARASAELGRRRLRAWWRRWSHVA
jgi:hypothetical protein